MERITETLNLGGGSMAVVGGLSAFLLLIMGVRKAMQNMYAEWKDVFDKYRAYKADGTLTEAELDKIMVEFDEASRATMSTLQVIKKVLKGVFNR